MKKYILLCVMFLCACMPDKASPNDLSYLSEKIIYFKDQRTNLCYAYAYYGAYGKLLSYVPCTKEVEALLSPYPTGLL